MSESFSEEDNAIFSEYVEEVSSDYKITRNRDGSIFSTSQSCSMKMTVPKGADFKTVWNWQRIQMSNKMRNDYENSRIKTPIKD